MDYMSVSNDMLFLKPSHFDGQLVNHENSR